MHAWNGTWGVIAVGAFADADLITNSYGTDVFSGGQRPYGFLFPGGGGHLLGAQIAYALFNCWCVAARFSCCCCLAWLRLADQ